MSYFEDHKITATVISVTIGIAAIALLYYLSTLADNEQPAPQDEYSTTVTTGNAQGDGSGSGGADDLEATGSGDIQRVDFSQMLAPEIGDDQTIEGLLLVDIDGNGSQEALLLVRGVGDKLPLDWYLFGIEDTTASRLFERHAVAQGKVKVDGPRIVEQEADYQPGDADCCPSRVKTSYYVWKDGELQVSKTEVSAPGVG